MSAEGKDQDIKTWSFKDDNCILVLQTQRWGAWFCMVASGSFGHFQASKSGVHKGGLDRSLVKAGFVATRISVS